MILPVITQLLSFTVKFFLVRRLFGFESRNALLSVLASAGISATIGIYVVAMSGLRNYFLTNAFSILLSSLIDLAIIKGLLKTPTGTWKFLGLIGVNLISFLPQYLNLMARLGR